MSLNLLFFLQYIHTFKTDEIKKKINEIKKLYVVHNVCKKKQTNNIQL